MRKFEGKVDKGSMRWLEREKIEDGRENACKSKKEMTKGERWLEKRDGKYPYGNTIDDQNMATNNMSRVDGVFRTRSLGVPARGVPDQYEDGKAAKVPCGVHIVYILLFVCCVLCLCV